MTINTKLLYHQSTGHVSKNVSLSLLQEHLQTKIWLLYVTLGLMACFFAEAFQLMQVKSFKYYNTFESLFLQLFLFWCVHLPANHISL